MDNELTALIRTAVSNWAKNAHNTNEIVIGMAAEDDIEDDEGTRYLVDLAARDVGHWLVVEVWVAEDEILSINELGEGLPLDGSEWPWSAETMN
jgi:hypothetical protein